MIKRIISFMAILLSSVAVLAQEFTVDGIKYNITSTSELTVSVGRDSYSGDIVIPDKVEYNGNEYSVTSIGDFAFSYCSGLTSVTIPNSVTSIGGGAFHYCSGLTSVAISNFVTTIGYEAFYGCSGLTSVNIPNSVTTIEGSAFYGCSGLTTLTIPNSVTSIGRRAFGGCSGLTSITIGNSVTSIEDETFFKCSSLTSVTIGNSVTSIEDYAFFGCYSLSSLTFHCANIGKWFTGTKNIKTVVIGEEVTTIGSEAFSGLSGLTSVIIPNSVTTIGEWAFNSCKGLTSVTIPNSVTKIGDGAFFYCTSLTSVTIPNSLTSIKSQAFAYTGLAAINIPNSVTAIEDHAFEGCSKLASVIIPNSVTTIGEWAFERCSKLASMTIPNSVTSIEVSAFYGCSNLTSIVVDGGNPTYDSRDNCNAIIATASNTLVAGFKNTTIPNSVTSIGSSAFYNCSGLTSVTIPNSVTSIGSSAFYNCSGLTSVTIPNSVTSIGDYAFSKCRGLTSVTIPNSVTSIGNESFYDCSGLTEIYSMISEPFEIATSCWSDVNKDIPLYVPAGCKAKYEATPGWNEFTNIVEIKEAAELEPVDESDNTDYGNGDIDDTTELNGNVVGNIYYNIADENGAYSSSEGCIVLKKPTTDSSVEGTDIFGEEFKNNFTGIIFKVHAGSGTIKVNAEAIGNMILKVKVGNNAPLSIELQGKMKASFPYTVSEESYVYIYGGESSSAAAKGTRAADTESFLKIYGIEWSETYEPSGIESLNNGSYAETVIYNLNGQRVNTPSKGVYIKNGRKVLVK